MAPRLGVCADDFYEDGPVPFMVGGCHTLTSQSGPRKRKQPIGFDIRSAAERARDAAKKVRPAKKVKRK